MANPLKCISPNGFKLKSSIWFLARDRREPSFNFLPDPTVCNNFFPVRSGYSVAQGTAMAAPLRIQQKSKAGGSLPYFAKWWYIMDVGVGWMGNKTERFVAVLEIPPVKMSIDSDIKKLKLK